MPVRAVVSDMRKMHVGSGSPFFISDLNFAESLFQTCSKADILQGKIHCNISITVLFMHFFLLLFSGFSELWRASV